MHKYHKKSSWFSKIAFLLFMIILIPTYLKNYGWRNFLWLSDIGLFITFFAILFSSSFLMSMVIIALPLEIAWNIDFFTYLFIGHSIVGLADYMFDDRLSLFLRGLSLFHIVLPILWVWYLITWGYDKRAFMYAILLFWIVAIATYVYTDPQENINWIFMPIVYHWQISPLAWLIMLMIGFPLFIFWPMHRSLLYFSHT